MNVFNNVLKLSSVPTFAQACRLGRIPCGRAAILARSLHTDPQRSVGPKTPDLIYIPHILRWIKTKFRFLYLKKSWDADFSEGAFIYGTVKALCKITEIIHKDQPEELDGLLTTSAQMKLEDDMGFRLTKMQKRIIQLCPNDIKILVPISVNFRNNRKGKWCDISLRSLALKWYNDSGAHKLVLVALQTEFVREYTKGAKPEWTISMFEVLECTTLQETQQR